VMHLSFLLPFEECNLRWVKRVSRATSRYFYIPLTFFFKNKDEVLDYMHILNRMLGLNILQKYVPPPNSSGDATGPLKYFGDVDFTSLERLEEYFLIMGANKKNAPLFARRWKSILAGYKPKYIYRVTNTDKDWGGTRKYFSEYHPGFNNEGGCLIHRPNSVNNLALIALFKEKLIRKIPTLLANQILEDGEVCEEMVAHFIRMRCVGTLKIYVEQGDVRFPPHLGNALYEITQGTHPVFPLNTKGNWTDDLIEDPGTQTEPLPVTDETLHEEEQTNEGSPPGEEEFTGGTASLIEDPGTGTESLPVTDETTIEGGHTNKAPPPSEDEPVVDTSSPEYLDDIVSDDDDNPVPCQRIGCSNPPIATPGHANGFCGEHGGGAEDEAQQDGPPAGDESAPAEPPAGNGTVEHLTNAPNTPVVRNAALEATANVLCSDEQNGNSRSNSTGTPTHTNSTHDRPTTPQVTSHGIDDDNSDDVSFDSGTQTPKRTNAGSTERARTSEPKSSEKSPDISFRRLVTDQLLGGRTLPAVRVPVTPPADVIEKKVGWTVEEDIAIVRGLQRHGHGRWVQIYGEFPAVFARNNRTALKIKDRVRNLKKILGTDPMKITEEQVRGIPDCKRRS
jgi:hypothetical protein